MSRGLRSCTSVFRVEPELLFEQPGLVEGVPARGGGVELHEL